jgi:Arc/MetJ-type ribon-helix-helix transcriptional regulator
MTTQIAVRLPDELVRYVDAQVADGAASSRADLIARVLAREERRQRALADIERMRRAGASGYPELDQARRSAQRRAIDLD